MNNNDLLSMIQDDDIRLIAKNADLINWEWGADSPLEKLAKIESAALMLREFFEATPFLTILEDGSIEILWSLLTVTAEKDEMETNPLYYDESVNDESVITANCNVGWVDSIKAIYETPSVYITKNSN